MNQLQDLLRDAADGPVGFDHRDIGRRVRYRRRTKVAAVAAAVVLGAVGIVGGAGDDEQVIDSVGPVVDGAVTVDELVADRWVAMAYSAVVVPPNPPAFLEFSDEGRLAGIDGCNIIDGTWDLEGTRLITDLEPTEDIRDACANATGDLLEILEADPTVGRFDAGMLELRSGELFVAFERFDRLGELATADALTGTWSDGTGDETAGQVTLEPDGTGVLELLDCSPTFEWSLDDDRLVVDGLDRSGIPCGDGIVGGGLLYTLTGSPRLRVSDSTLWVSSDLGVALLRSTAADPATTTSTTMDDDRTAAVELEAAALVVPFVTASTDGVTRHDGPTPTRIADGPAAVAFAVGPDIVVHQPASTDFPQYPLHPEGTPQVWRAGERRDLPVAAGAARVHLLDARLLDGAPVALLAEAYGGVGPDDTFEELVLVDLETFDRRSLVRRPAWEAEHGAGHLLPDGDVIGLFGAESTVVLARWTEEVDEPLWTAEIDADLGPTLTVVDDEVRVMDGGRFTDDFTPALHTWRYGLDGTEGGEETFTVADSAGELGTGLFCTGWYDPAHVVCGRSDGPPILVSTTTGAFEPLSAATGSYPTVVR